ncbi:MAG: thioredoxin family protein [Oscillospiraceae bacterium]|nr:thioredoxin family protein [Oscillospiraceae bacterium]
MIENLDKQGFEALMQTSGKRIVVVFTADWCPYCKRLAPIMEEIAVEYTSEIEVYNVNTDEHPDLAARYNIMSIPTVFVFTGGEVKGSAVNPRTKKALLKLIFE